MTIAHRTLVMLPVDTGGGRLAYGASFAFVSREDQVVVKHPADKPGPYLRLIVILLSPLVNLLFRRSWLKAHHIPSSGPAIIVANHISHADPVVFARYIWDAGRVPRFLAKESLFRVRLMGRFISGAGQIPVYRGSADAVHSLQAAVAALVRGEVVMIYPEGTVTRDPQFWPMQAKTGVARLALLAPDVPVIPVAQWGEQEFLNYYQRRFRPLPRKHVTISAGEPIDLSEFVGRQPTAEILRTMTDRIMGAVRDELALVRGEQPPDAFYRSPARTAQESRG